MEAMFEPAQMAPHSQDAEESVLGSIFINPDAYLEVADFLEGDDFFILRNAYVWEAMTRLHDRGELIDYLTVIEELRKQTDLTGQSRLEDIGGAAYITYLTSNVGTSIYAETYGHLVKVASLRRKGLDFSLEIARLMREEDIQWRDIEARVYAALDKIFGNYTAQSGVNGRDAMSDYLTEIEHRDVVPGITSGTTLDQLLVGNGFQPGYWAMVGFTHKGKSTLMLWMALQAAKKGYAVGFWTLEMTRQEVLHKLIAMEADIDADALFENNLTPAQYQAYKDAKNRLIYQNAVMPQALRRQGVAYHESRCVPIMDMFTIYDQRDLTHMEWSKQARVLRRNQMLDIAFVDYTQIMLHIAKHRDETYAKSIGETVRRMQAAAKELSIPVIAGAQANRASQQSSKKQALWHIADSSDIEKNADGVMFIDDDGDYDDLTDMPPVIRKKVSILKQRFPGGKKGVRYYTMTLQSGTFVPADPPQKVDLSEF